MKRSAPDDFNAPDPKRNRSNDPLPESRITRVVYDPRTTPRNNTFYDPSMDEYLGLNPVARNRANPDYDPSMDRYLGL